MGNQGFLGLAVVGADCSTFLEEEYVSFGRARGGAIFAHFEKSAFLSTNARVSATVS